MPRYEIVDARPVHLSMVARRLREADRLEILAAGVEPRHVMFILWRNSTHRTAAFVDGEIAMVGGCAGTLASPTGEPWLFTTAAIERVPMAFAKESRRWLSEVLRTKSCLRTACHASYEKSARFWTMLGFKVGAPERCATGELFRPMVLER